MYLPQGTPALTPTRKSTTLPSQPSLPARVPGRKTEGTTSGETTTENDVQVSISISFRSDFATVLRAPCFVYDGKFYTIYDFTIDTTTTSGQPVRFFCLVRTTAATRPAWFSISIPHRFARAFQSPISRIRFHRITIAQRTLPNQLRLCRVPKHSRCRGRLQRHVRSQPSDVPPFTPTHRDIQARKEPRWTSSEHPGLWPPLSPPICSVLN